MTGPLSKSGDWFRIQLVNWLLGDFVATLAATLATVTATLIGCRGGLGGSAGIAGCLRSRSLQCQLTHGYTSPFTVSGGSHTRSGLHLKPYATERSATRN
jgi:hypothetical protein